MQVRSGLSAPGQPLGVERSERCFVEWESVGQPAPFNFFIDIIAMADCPNGHRLLFNFIDNPVIPYPNLPKAPQRLSQACPIACRVRHQPLPNGTDDPHLDIPWNIWEVVIVNLWAVVNLIGGHLLDLELDLEPPLQFVMGDRGGLVFPPLLCDCLQASIFDEF